MELSLADVSHVIRLVLEVCDRWDDPRAWREHLLRAELLAYFIRRTPMPRSPRLGENAVL